MPPLLPTLPFPHQEQGQLPQVQVGWPCPDPLASSRVPPPPQRALQTGPWQKARFPPCCLCAGGGVGGGVAEYVIRGRNVALGHPRGGKGMAEMLVDAGKHSQQGCHTPTPQGPRTPTQGPHSQPRRLQVCPLAGNGKGWWLSPWSWHGWAI